MQLVLNPNVINIKESATLAINQRIKKLRAAQEQVYHFGFGESPFPVPGAIQLSLKNNSDKKNYLPTRGLPELLDAVAGFYRQYFDYSYTADQVCIGPGSKELIFQTIYILEGPLFIPAPGWVSYGPQAALRGKQIVTIETRRENSYRLQATELVQACEQWGDGQKILIFNNPGNPTGSVHDQDEIRDIANICRDNNIIVISDEIYAMVNFTGKDHTGLAHYYPEGTIVTGGLSKSFSAGGYRLGVMLVPPDLAPLLATLTTMISETFSSVSAPVQYAAITAYQYDEDLRREVERCTEIHQFTGQYLFKRFMNMGLNCPEPDGAFYLFPDFENFREQLAARSIETSKQLTDTILDEVRLAVLPASEFYLPATHLGTRVASVDYDGQLVLQAFPGKDGMNEEQMNLLFPNLVKGCDALEQFLLNLK